MKEYYVYIHLNPKTNEIFYIGKGKGNRKSSKVGRNEKWKKYVSNLTEQFKILILKENLSDKEALELERKVISKIDWHYDDLTTNITDSLPNFEGGPAIQIVFKDSKELIKAEKFKPNFKFQNLSDSEIISTLLNFPNELSLNKIIIEFENQCEFFHDNYDELENADEDIFYDIECIIDSIEDLLVEYKSSNKSNIIEFITELKRERIEIEMIQEEKPKGKQKQFLSNLTKWIDSLVEN